MKEKSGGGLKERPNEISTASLQFRIEPSRVPWIYAALKNQPQVKLYSGDFPEPFTKLLYVLRHNQGQLIFAAALEISDDFKSKYGETVGSAEDLAPLLQRYPKHEFSPDGRQLAVYDNGGQIQGVIARVSHDQIIVQRGGGAGQLSLEGENNQNPLNNLSVHLDTFNLLVQRYVSTVWKTSPETDKKKVQLVLDVPTLPEGAMETYFSTFATMGKEFLEHPRPVDLDENIGGYPRIKALIKSLFLDLTDPDVSRAFGTQPFSNKFVLITGAEGTGKSLFPKALDKMLRTHYGDKFEHFRLPLAGMLAKYGAYTAIAISTILNHIQENEKKGIPTLLHLDNFEQLIPRHQRPIGASGNLLLAFEQGTTYYQSQTPPSDAEFNYALQTINPIIEVLHEFGRNLGNNSRNVIVYGESRLPREFLPERAARIFRRSFDINNPTIGDLIDILRVQIETSTKFAEGTGRNPFASDIQQHLSQIAQHALGLNGRDIQQAILNVATSKKAEQLRKPTTNEEISAELARIRLAKGLENPHQKGALGFRLPHQDR